VQVLLRALGELTIGRRIYWPVFEAASRFGLPVCLHTGGLYRHAPMGNGWPSYFVEDYVTQSAGFEGAWSACWQKACFRSFPI
jgi:predicted TIM-barrel fold metal-dependent hydrolase